MTENRKIKEVRIIFEGGGEISIKQKELTELQSLSDVLETIRLFVKAWRSRGNAEEHS